MPTLSRLPGELNLIFVIGNDMPITVDLSTDVTGATFDSDVYVDGQGAFAASAGSGFSTTPGDEVFSPTVTVTDASEGELSIALSETQTALLSPNVNYRWHLTQTLSGDTRTILGGTVEARNP